MASLPWHKCKIKRNLRNDPLHLSFLVLWNRISKFFVADTASFLHKKHEWRIVIRLESQTDSSLRSSTIWKSIETITFTAECLRTRMSPISSYSSSRLLSKGSDLRFYIYIYTVFTRVICAPRILRTLIFKAWFWIYFCSVYLLCSHWL
jgi:hypothetical protein